jgi:1-acyl-sn-glycerol-3-phosphate acyltransferase
MEGLFLAFYTFFRNRRILFAILVILVPITGIFLGSRMILEEDISKTLPGENDKSAMILKNSRFTNKLILNIFLTDSLKPSDPDKLIDFSGELIDSLNNKNMSRFLAPTTFRISDTLAENVMNLLYQNLPVFLNDKDYNKIDSLLTEEAIGKSIEKNYKSLISPAGFGMKKYILQDPVGIVSLALFKLKQFQIEDGYEIIDGYIFTKTRRNLLLFINPLNPPSDTRQNAVFFRNLDKLLNYLSAKNNFTIKTEYFGSSAVSVGNASQIKKDISVTVTLAVLIILLFIGLFFRNRAIPFISFLPAVFGGILAMAIIFIIKGKMSTIALGIGSVLLGIIVDYALYFYSLYNSKRSVEVVIRDLTMPILMCSLTSSIAFFSLLFVKSEVLRDLGLFAGLSILGAALFALTVLPHLIGFRNKSAERKKPTLINRIVIYQYESSRLIVLLIFIITIFLFFFYKKAGFESDMNSMNFLTPRLKVAEKNLGRINDISLKSIYIFSAGKDLSQALSLNERVASTLEKLKDKNIVRKYTNAGSILISDSIQKARIQKWTEYWSPAKKEKIRNLIITAGKDYGFNKDAFSKFYVFLDRDFQPVGIDKFNSIRTLFLNDMITENNDINMVMSLVRVNNEDRQKVASALSGEKNIIIIDTNEITHNLVKGIKSDFDLLVNLCLVFVTLTLIISFGRFETGIVAAVPMFVSWLWTLGFMGITGIKFNIFNIIVSTFVFGLGVDYSILMMQGLLLEYRYGQNDLPTYKTSIFLSSFTTIAGVGVLLLARHPALNSIALISIIGLISVVMLSYTAEPILFRWLIQKNGKRRVLPLTLSDILFTIVALSIGLILCIFLNLLLFVVYPLPITSGAKKKILHHGVFWCVKMSSYGLINIRTRTINDPHEDFSKPAIIISNHQSHIDLPLLLMQSPKMIVLTNKWVWNNPLYALVIRYLGFYSVTKGYEPLIEKLRRKTEEGYSILVFPEGTRSADSSIKRFHKGAFLLAEKLNLDILPVIIHGAGDCMTKGENHLRSGTVTIKILPRLKSEDTKFGTDYHERTKAMLRYFRDEFTKMKSELETPRYFRRKLLRNYIYKGPVLEWYTRVKLSLEHDYEIINNIIPQQALIIDIGCGYGMISYMLSFTSDKRHILGVDYDNNKIKVADNCISKNERVSFAAANAVTYNYPEADVFLLSDVLHYVPEEKQAELLTNCLSHLKPNGIILIRDADKDLKKRHLGTRYTEFFSTRSGFNKSLDRKLFFFSGKQIREFAGKNNLRVEVIDETKLTSNLLYILKH